WEHEFNGKGKVTTNGLPIEAASLKGSSGVAEVGVSIGRKNVRTTLYPATGNVNAGTANANADMSGNTGASDRAPSQTQTQSSSPTANTTGNKATAGANASTANRAQTQSRSNGVAYVVTGERFNGGDKTLDHSASIQGGVMVDANTRAGTNAQTSVNRGNAGVGAPNRPNETGNAVPLGTNVGSNANTAPSPSYGEAGMSTSGNWTFDFTVTAYTGKREGLAGTAKFVYQW
ncbi:MAG: hypothetical protein LBG61_03900, partial [Burkholderiales bacterium]|nr:hypothetical protein [Burkholderiales bacterium]